MPSPRRRKLQHEEDDLEEELLEDEPSGPIEAKGGIKAQSQKGSFGENWWAKRWIRALEKLGTRSRLERGQSYARMGQVLAIRMAIGEIRGKVQGSRKTPYSVVVQVRPLPQKAWTAAAKAVAAKAAYVSKLLAGKMPHEIEQLFRKVGYSLFPSRLDDLRTSCTCPDDKNPCKHVAAVYYLVGEEFDRDPFLIFAMRGIEPDEFLKLLSGRHLEEEEEEAESPEVRRQELPADPGEFWTTKGIPDDITGTPPEDFPQAALPRGLGKFPLWHGAGSLLDSLDPLYRHAALRADQTLVFIAAAREARSENG